MFVLPIHLWKQLLNIWIYFSFNVVDDRFTEKCSFFAIETYRLVLLDLLDLKWIWHFACLWEKCHNLTELPLLQVLGSYYLRKLVIRKLFLVNKEIWCIFFSLWHLYNNRTIIAIIFYFSWKVENIHRIFMMFRLEL